MIALNIQATKIFQGDLQAFCNDDPDRLFAIPEMLAADFQEVYSLVCSMNYTAITRELSDVDVDVITNIVGVFFCSVCQGNLVVFMLIGWIKYYSALSVPMNCTK